MIYVANIPAELRAIPCWILWRAELTDDGKPTKVPYSAHTLQRCDVTNPESWASFEQVCSHSASFTGPGWCFSDHTAYSGVDLDMKVHDPDKAALFNRIIDELDSYSELSPSGQGVHVIVKGKVEGGRRRAGVEVYSRDRFFTFTGNVLNGRTVVNERQAKLEILFNELGKGASNAPVVNAEARLDDNTVIERCAYNTEWGMIFRELWGGLGLERYGDDKSARDQALANYIAVYTDNLDQCERVFSQSEPGKREKWQRRADYRKRTCEKAFDRKLDISLAEAYRLATAEKLKAMRAHAEPIYSPVALLNAPAPLPAIPAEPNRLSLESVEFPPGLIGELAQYIFDRSPRPVRVISLAAALGFFAGLVGRQYNVNGTGLNLYIALLAPSGRGKEALARGISGIAEACASPPPPPPKDSVQGYVHDNTPAVYHFIGPGHIVSAPALLKYLTKRPSFSTVIGEFGDWLAAHQGEKASTVQKLLVSTLLDLYGKSGRADVARPIIYSDPDKNTVEVHSPNLTIIGEGVCQKFYEVVDEDMISKGFLPRFLTLEYNGKRVANNKNALNAQLKDSTVTNVRALVEYMSHCQRTHTVQNVPISPEASAMLADFDAYCDDKINSARRDSTQQLWNRAHLKLLKIAGAYAVSENWQNPYVQRHNVEQAKHLIVADIQRMLERFDTGDVGNSSAETKQIEAVKHTVVQYLKGDLEHAVLYGATPQMHAAHIVPYGFIQRRLVATAAFKKDRIGATNAIKRTVQTLVETSWLNEFPKGSLQVTYGTSQRAFTLADITSLEI